MNLVLERQARELAHHEERAREHSRKAVEPVNLNVTVSVERQPWNAYWSTYDILMGLDLRGMRVLVPGCGFGEDAIRLASLGAEVYASDLSVDMLEIARRRAAFMGMPSIDFAAMPAESLTYADGFFDLVFFNDILHHVDIPLALAEMKRVMKPGGRVVANELYTHSSMQKIRESRFIKDFLYHRMVRFIYGTDRPYITEDEHKIDERELAQLEAYLAPGFDMRYFLFLGGRVLPNEWDTVAKFDQAALGVAGAFGRKLAGRVVLSGRVQ